MNESTPISDAQILEAGKKFFELMYGHRGEYPYDLHLINKAWAEANGEPYNPAWGYGHYEAIPDETWGDWDHFWGRKDPGKNRNT